MKAGSLRALGAGWAGGLAGNAFLGAAFSASWVREVLYDPAHQSALFITVTPQRNVAVSVIGLVLLSGLHGLLFARLAPALPGRSWLSKGLAWGAVIWSLYWLFQEWFVYVTLLDEPWPLAFLELAILLVGAVIEGIVIAGLALPRARRA